MDDKGQATSDRDQTGLPEFPLPLPNEEHEPEDWVVLRTMSSDQAHAIYDKLDGAGIPFETSGESEDSSGPVSVSVLVLQEDWEAASNLLADSSPASPDDDKELRDEDWYLKHWRCPSCHDQSLELMPASRRAIRLRWWMLGIFLSPFALMIIRWLFPAEFVVNAIDGLPGWVMLVWIVALGSCFFMMPSRRRRCPKCSGEFAV